MLFLTYKVRNLAFGFTVILLFTLQASHLYYGYQQIRHENKSSNDGLTTSDTRIVDGKIFSSFTCVDAPETMCTYNNSKLECDVGKNQKVRGTCLFKNVCVGNTVDELYYYIPSNKVAVLPPLELWNTNKQTIKIMPIQAQLDQKITPRTLLISHLQVAKNMGHTLMDEVLPLFRILSKFGLSFFVENVTIATNNPSTLHKLLTESLVSRMAVTNTCYSRVILGSSLDQFGDRTHVLVDGLAVSGYFKGGQQVKSFRNLVYKRLNISSFSSSSSSLSFEEEEIGDDLIIVKNKKFKVLFAEKDLEKADHKGGWKNLHDIVNNLKVKHPEWDVSIIMWSQVTQEEQIRLVHSTDVFITLAGSDSIPALFMRDNTHLILFCRLENAFSTHLVQSHEHFLLYRHVSYIKTLELCEPIVSKTDFNYINVNYETIVYVTINYEVVLNLLEGIYNRLI